MLKAITWRQLILVVALLALAALAAIVSGNSSFFFWSAAAVAVGGLVGLAIAAADSRLSATSFKTATFGGRHQADGAGREYVVPAEVPPPPAQLLGRDGEIDNIRALLSNESTGRPLVIAINGPAGIGKTALAVRVAHLVAGNYPDGQLLVRFDSQGGRTVEEALTLLVESLRGHLEDSTTADLEAWYHRHTSKRRVLVILDNVNRPTGDLQQINRLLPTGDGCAVLITSRDPLPYVNADATFDLEPLHAADAHLLLDTLVGNERVAAEPEEASRIVRLCACYPAALDIVGTALARRRNATLRLALQRTDEVALPDTDAELPPFTGALDLAYALLTHRERTAVTLLGLLDARTVTPWMLAALYKGAAGSYPEEVSTALAGRVLDRLAHARLAERQTDDESGVLMFRIPKYVQEYARARLTVMVDQETQNAAKRGYLEESQRRSSEKPEEWLRRTVYRHLAAGQLSAALESAREALALSQELQGQVHRDTAEAAAAAAEEGLTLAALAEVYAELGWIDAGLECTEAARREAKVSPRSYPRTLRVSGKLRRRHRQLVRARSDLTAARTAAMELGDKPEQIRVLRELAAVQALDRDLKAGHATVHEAIALCSEVGASGAHHLAGVHWAQSLVFLEDGQYAEAHRVLDEADAQSTDPEIGKWIWIWRPWVRYQRAVVALRAGDYDLTRECGRYALEAFTGIKHRYGVAHCRLAIGCAYLAEGDVHQAASYLKEAYGTLRRCGDRWLEATAATELASAYRQIALVERRVDRARQAVELLVFAEQTFIKLGDPAAQGRAALLLWELESELPARWSARWPGYASGPGRTHGQIETLHAEDTKV
jgi:tetratricopeptide (TPR) repeat protein